ncbi:hypothetical protein [Paenibacillus sp. J22TS3]|uniref:hypothetical protein n=1 Tax=Paenibacillus sp. J22TS3 TaxID=2807192 RepID=UPI001B0C88D4|nr:hypothetical protein [Paenibacillus sp. J22TS3]GIP22737.1 hypothetical protein J22TS3_30120 [Paenibacillus sp. J22TS3]
MKSIKIPLILILFIVFSISVVACGNNDIIHKKSNHWDVSLQRITGYYQIKYLGQETLINNFGYEITGNNISQKGNALKKQTPPFEISGNLSDSENTKGPIKFKMNWNNQSETVIFE